SHHVNFPSLRTEAEYLACRRASGFPGPHGFIAPVADAVDAAVANPRLDRQVDPFDLLEDVFELVCEQLGEVDRHGERDHRAEPPIAFPAERGGRTTAALRPRRGDSDGHIG